MASPSHRVWILDDDESVRWVIDRALRGENIRGRQFSSAAELMSQLEEDQPDLLITDVRMPGMSGLELMERIQQGGFAFPIIVMTAHADLDTAVAAYQSGAFEYLPKPFDIDDAMVLVWKALRQEPEPGEAGSVNPSPLPAMIGQAPAMQEVFRTIGRLSRASMNVLITGESGTGKELIARALHEHSPRARHALVALNTTAISPELLESELFGHERGAFTGADSRRIGRFEQADKGSLFLDEIGDMSLALQTRLLRVLAEGEFYRVGGQAPIHVDVRVIAATHQDLQAAVSAGTFREDLFHRLNVINIQAPPLRDRREDIPLLLQHYLREAARELGGETKSLSPEAMARLQKFRWPGNVRQLVNVCRRLTVSAPGPVVQLEDMPLEFGGLTNGEVPPDWVADLALWAEIQLVSGKQPPLLEKALPEFERTLIRVALNSARGHRQEAARLLGWGRNTLTRKIRELGLEA